MNSLVKKIAITPIASVSGLVQIFNHNYKKWNRETPVGQNLSEFDKIELAVYDFIKYDLPVSIIANIYYLPTRIKRLFKK